MSFTAVYDACVLYPPSVRDLLVRLAQTGLFAARWSDAILDEMVESILERQPEVDRSRLERTRQLMCEAVRDCLVTGYERLIDGLELPDPDDRHVLAAAIRANAQVIVTSNLSDFPDSLACPSRASSWVTHPPPRISRVASRLRVPACRRHYPGGIVGGSSRSPQSFNRRWPDISVPLRRAGIDDDF